MKKLLIAIILLQLLLSCNGDDNGNNITIEITTEDFIRTIDENPTSGFELGTVIGSANFGDVLFEIESQTPSNAMSIDNETGLLIVLDPSTFDFELNPSVTGIVKVSNQDIFAYSNITININDIDDSMLSVENFVISIDENPEPNQIIGSISASTDQGELSFSIESQEPESAFQIDEDTGELSVADVNLFDYELNETITGIVKVSNQDIFVYSNITININDIDDSMLSVEDFIVSIDENPEPNQIIGSISASTDQGELSFSIESQEPESAFQIDEDTGELSVADVNLFDYELNETITGIVKVSNQDIFAYSNVTITLNDVVEPDIVVTASNFEITINEGPLNQQSLGFIEASTNQGILSYALIEQYPENAFSIDTASGELKVENPSLFNYEINPVVTGSFEVSYSGVSATASITINLLDIEEQDLLLSSVDSNYNITNPYEAFYPTVTDGIHILTYTNNEIEGWLLFYGGYINSEHYEHTFTTNDNLITYISSYVATDQGEAVCNWDFNITYNSSDRITNIEYYCVDEYDLTVRNYNLEYSGSTVSFIDQVGSNDISIVINSNNQITNITTNSNSTNLTYDGENLISIVSNDNSIFLEYDTYRNPFRIELAETFNLAQIHDFLSVIGFSAYSKSYNYLRNTNNITKITSSASWLSEVNYSYEYNVDDYPIRKTMDVQEGVVEFFYN